MRVCPEAQFDFFSTAFEPRAWTMVVFWMEGRFGTSAPLITLENEGGGETSSPSPPNFTFFDDPYIRFRARPRGHFDQPRGPCPEPRWTLS